MASSPILARAHLGAVALALLARRDGDRSGARCGGPALAALLSAHGYVAHEAALAFEEAYGGLVLREPSWSFGPFACLTGLLSAEPPRGEGHQRRLALVPVACAANSVVYFLDRKGRGFVQDIGQDAEAELFARNGRALVTRILVSDEMFVLGEGRRVHLAGRHGAAIAKLLGAPLLEDVSAHEARIYSDGDVHILDERAGLTTRGGTTWVAARTRRRLAPLQPFLGGGLSPSSFMTA